MSLMSNIVIEPQNHKRSEFQFEDDSLSFSRDKSKDMESMHSLLTNNNDITRMTFTKKDIVVVNSCHSEKR